MYKRKVELNNQIYYPYNLYKKNYLTNERITPITVLYSVPNENPLYSYKSVTKNSSCV